jgi:competence protein ComGC
MTIDHQDNARECEPQLPNGKRYGFTLIQIVISLGVILLLAAILIPSVRGVTRNARRAQCDTRLKAIALSLNNYRQETGHYPASLDGIVSGKYYTEPLRCPNDPRPNGSYADFYVLRAPRDRHELPILVCPFHEQDGHHGAQAFVGSYTRQFTTRPAVLQGANNVTVLRPGKNPIQGAVGMELYGGDRLQTAGSGIAEIRFADNSVAEIASNSDVTVLQSFIEGQSDAPLYSLIRQQKGTATYTVNHGSRFDVVTPTVTAGALGTKFTIVVDDAGNASIKVLSGNVSLSTVLRTALAPVNTIVSILPDLPGLPPLTGILGF